MANILYVEDNEDTANAVKIMLESLGHKITLAQNGAEAKKALQQQYNIILLDIMLPDTSGWDLFSTFKKKTGTTTKYAFLSAIPVSGERLAELQQSGVSDYITKPFTKETLAKSINKMLK